MSILYRIIIKLTSRLSEPERYALLGRLLPGTSHQDRINAWSNTFEALYRDLHSSYEAVEGRPEAATGMMHAEATIKHAAARIAELEGKVKELSSS